MSISVTRNNWSGASTWLWSHDQLGGGRSVSLRLLSVKFGCILLNHNHLTSNNVFYVLKCDNSESFVLENCRKIPFKYIWHCWHQNYHSDQYYNIFYITWMQNVEAYTRERTMVLWVAAVSRKVFFGKKTACVSSHSRKMAWGFSRHNVSLVGGAWGQQGDRRTAFPGFRQSFGRRAPTTGLSEQNSFHQPGRSSTWWPCITVDHRFL